MSNIPTFPNVVIAKPEASYVPPGHFWALAATGIAGIFACILASIFFAPASNPTFHFSEDGAINALSSVTLAVTAAFAFVVFYLRTANFNSGTVFWLILAAGSLFLSLDEQLQFHERGGSALELTRIGKSELLRNWNDLIVIAYGLAALGIGALFRHEIFNCRVFAMFFAAAFGFYAIHTGIDSLVPTAVAWKDIPEESAKLLSVFSVLLGVFAQLLAVIERSFLGRQAGHGGI